MSFDPSGGKSISEQHNRVTFRQNWTIREVLLLTLAFSFLFFALHRHVTAFDANFRLGSWLGASLISVVGAVLLFSTKRGFLWGLPRLLGSRLRWFFGAAFTPSLFILTTLCLRLFVMERPHGFRRLHFTGSLFISFWSRFIGRGGVCEHDFMSIPLQTPIRREKTNCYQGYLSRYLDVC